MTQTTFPSSLAETYAYDAIGNLISKTDRKGQTITYLYACPERSRRNALNRLTQKTYPDTSSVEYVYDLVGKVMQVNDPTGTDFNRSSASGSREGPSYPPAVSQLVRSKIIGGS